jgi:hypothetical protein
MEQRRTQRYTLALPLSITRSGKQRIAADGYTRNISSTGVLFTADQEPGIGGPIEYVIALNHEGAQHVDLRCIGKVVRADRLTAVGNDTQMGYQVAATLERYQFVRAR